MTLPIEKTLYPGYSLLFLFDNAISYSLHTKNALPITKMNKSSSRKKANF